MKGTRGLGSAGERLALDHLRNLGYVLLESNWRCARGEIDLVMHDVEVLVFVEVRTRRGEELGTPEESVTRAKQERLAMLAMQWLEEHYAEREPPEWRIDVVGIHLSAAGTLTQVNHVPSAVGY